MTQRASFLHHRQVHDFVARAVLVVAVAMVAFAFTSDVDVAGLF